MSSAVPEDATLMAILDLFKDRVESVEVVTAMGEAEHRFEVRMAAHPTRSTHFFDRDGNVVYGTVG